MRRFRCSVLLMLATILGLLSFVAASAEEPSQSAVSTFNVYIGVLESRLAQQHRSPNGFLVSINSNPQREADLHRGEVRVERLTLPAALVLPGALLHHWRGTAFVPGIGRCRL